MNENTLSSNLQKIKTATVGIRTTLDMSTEDIEDVATAVSELKEEKDSLDTQVENLNEQVSELNDTIDRKDTQISDLVDEVDQKDDEIADLEQQLEEVTPVGNISITENGENIDVAHYETATVNVSGGGSTNIYRVETIQERDELNPNEGDLCVVISTGLGNWRETTTSNTITFPKNVTLPNERTTWYERARLVGDNYFAEIGMGPEDFRLDSYEGIELMVDYQSNDGIHYTRGGIICQDMETGQSYRNGDTITLPMSLTFNSSVVSFDDDLGYFMQTNVTSFGGIFEYKNDSWEYACVEATTIASEIYKGRIAYTDNGPVTGTLGSAATNDTLKLYDEICEFLTTWQPTTLYRQYMYNTHTTIPTTKLLNTSLVTNMSGVFRASRITNLDINDWLTHNVTDMSAMFEDCQHLTSLELSGWDTSNVITMERMFGVCLDVTSLDLSGFTSESLTNISGMFYSCRSLMFLDVRGLEFTNISNTTNLFQASNLGAVPDNCLIIVKNGTQKSWLLNNYSRFTNVKTVEEYESGV